jgi:hypothetical protein
MDNDFRQISVLSQLAKVLEIIQLKLNKGGLKIKDNQHAFTHGRSTVSALASITQNWFTKTENSRDGRRVSTFYHYLSTFAKHLICWMTVCF